MSHADSCGPLLDRDTQQWDTTADPDCAEGTPANLERLRVSFTSEAAWREPIGPELWNCPRCHISVRVSWDE